MSCFRSCVAATALAVSMLGSPTVRGADWWYRDLTGTAIVTVEGRGMGLHNVSPRRVGVSRLADGGNLHAWWGTPDDDVTESVIAHYQANGFPASLDHDHVVACWLADGTDRIVGRIHVSLNEEHTRKQWRSWICSTPELRFPVRVIDLGELTNMTGLSMNGINNDWLAAGTIQLRRSPGIRKTTSAVVGGLRYPSSTVRDLLLLSSRGNSRAYAVSNPGWVVGSSAHVRRRGLKACLWREDDGWTQTFLDFSTDVNPSYLDSCLDNEDSRSAAFGVASEYDKDSSEHNHVIAGYCSNSQQYGPRDVDLVRWKRPVLWIYEGDTLICVIDPAAEMRQATYDYGDPHSMEPLEEVLESVHGVFLDANAHWYGVGWVKTGSFSNPDPSDTDRPDDDDRDDLTNKRAIRITGPQGCDISSGVRTIQSYDRLFWTDRPGDRVEESERTLLTAVAINDDFRIVGSAQHGEDGPIHAYLIWPMGVQDDLVPPGCGPDCQPMIWTPESAEPRQLDPALRAAYFGPGFLIGTRKADGSQPRDPRTEQFHASNIRILSGDGAVVEQLSSSDFKEDLRFLVAGKTGDWAVGYWDRRLHLLGEPEAVGAQQGFDATDDCTMRIVWDPRTGRVRPRHREVPRNQRFFVRGDTRADGGLFLDIDDYLFCFGKAHETGEHVLPEDLVDQPVKDLACGDRFNCVILRESGAVFAWGSDEGRPLSDLASTGLAAEGKDGLGVSDVAATRRGIIALADDGTLHVFGTAAGASPGKPRVFQPEELGLETGTTIVEVKAFPATDAWTFLDSNGLAHLQGASIRGRTSFPAHGGFLPGFAAKTLITVAPMPNGK